MTDQHSRILITGGNGFLGSRVVHALLEMGFTNLVCTARSGGGALSRMAADYPEANLDIVVGNLLSREVCRRAADGVEIVYHLAASKGRNFPACVMNSVVTTRNLLDALVQLGRLQRFVNVSSMSVYSNEGIPRGGLLTESAALDDHLAARNDPYAYAKARQDEIVQQYADEHDIPVVTVRPGFVIGPGKPGIPGRVGNGNFGLFLHLGLSNEMPFTYVDNCAEAVVKAGLAPDVAGEVFLIVDDDRPTSREYLRRYKKQVRRFASVPLPYPIYFRLNHLLESYSRWSKGQLPMTFNRRTAAAYYKGNTYSNDKAKRLLGWYPRISMDEALERCFADARSSKGSSS